ncbi:MAG: SGNH/GDSL hydrolase family protein [Candidatus Sumerlaeota bacterium]|nr:SGNH/GDSL hydrolase family protein [Candidatus Sumerlaeota bacterium]
MKLVVRKIDLKVLALLAGLFIGLLILEIALRIVASLDRSNYQTFRNAPRLLGGKPSHLNDYIRASAWPDLVYELTPNVKGDQLSEYYQRPITINADGMRDRAFLIPKPPDVFRIAALGDSIAFGWGVGDEENYPKLLERYLNLAARPGVRFEVLNFGVPGYNAAMEAAQYERKGRKYGPDAVLIQSVANDRDLPNFLARKRNPWSLRRSFLLDRLRGIPLTRELFEAPVTADLGGRQHFAFPADQFPEEFRALWGDEAVERALGQIARSARDDGAAFVQFVAPTDLKPEHFQTRKAQPDELAEFLALGKKCGGLQIDCTADIVGAVEEFGLKPEQLWVWPWDQHPNEIGHRILAWSLLRRLKDLGVLKDRISDDLGAVEAAYRAEVAEWMKKPAWEDRDRAKGVER